MLNEEQQFVADLADHGHNLFIDGSAGTGKSFLLQSIYRNLSRKGKSVALTCTTGIACMNFDRDLNAQTIHRWSGIQDGRYNSSEVIALVKSNEISISRIKNTDVLIIDEISMLSQKLFDQICEICSLKDKSHVLGGIQLIVSGDFNQLAPTPNPEYNDDGSFCFNSSHFKKLHHVKILNVVRQKDKYFINVIKEVSTGKNISDSTVDFIKSLERPLDKGCETMKLFSKKDLVNSYNRQMILAQPGDLFEYTAIDTGDQKHLQKCNAEQKLWLKVGSPVILIRNLSQILVNGLQGKVVRCEDSGPVVFFPAISTTTMLKKESFSVYSPLANRTLANRDQVPLLLAYAITIHKSQGMTVDRIEIDCRHIFRPGQLGVGMGRVRNAAGLRIINFHPKYCLPQPDSIEIYNSEASLELKEDLTCCRTKKALEEDTQSHPVDDFWIESELEVNDTDADFDEQFNDIISRIDMSAADETDAVNLPEKYHLDAVLHNCMTENPVTPIQEEVNEIVRNILAGDKRNVIKFCKHQFEEISKITEKLNAAGGAGVKAEKLADMYADFHKYQTGDNYRISALLLFKESQFTSAHSHICTNITVSIRKFCIQEKADLYTISDREISNRTVTEAAKARIRYVGGYCINATKKPYQKEYRAKMYNTSIQGQEDFKRAEEKLKILNTFTEEEEILRQNSTDKASLLDVDRRQYITRGLLNITDDMYSFFVKLCDMVLKILIDKNLNIHSSKLHENALSEILKSTHLFECFTHIVSAHNISTFEISTNLTVITDDNSVITSVISELERNVENICVLYKEITVKFLNVMFNQFRKDVLESFSVAKTMAHRKQIQVRQQKKSAASKTMTYETVVQDKTGQKEMSHSLMKGMLLNQLDIFCAMTKKQITLLCTAYNLKPPKSDKKSVLIQKLTKEIIKSDNMPNYSCLGLATADLSQHTYDEPVPSTSQDVTRGLQTAVQPLMESYESQPPKEVQPPTEIQPHVDGQPPDDEVDNDDELCGRCHKTGKPGVLWIQCSVCSVWLHRNCAGLKDKKKWKKYSDEGKDFFCSQCQ